MKMLRYIVAGLAFAGILYVTGCVTDNPPSGESYPGYNCWWR